MLLRILFYLGLLFTLLVLSCSNSPTEPDEIELLLNRSFEEIDSNGVPKHWEYCYGSGNGPNPTIPEIKYSIDSTIFFSGEKSVSISSSKAFSFTGVKVQQSIVSNELYGKELKLSAWIKWSNVEGPYDYSSVDIGVHFYTPWSTYSYLGVYSSWSTEKKIIETGDWTYFEVKCRPLNREEDGDNRALLVTLDLERATGKVWFDDVSLTYKK